VTVTLTGLFGGTFPANISVEIFWRCTPITGEVFTPSVEADATGAAYPALPMASFGEVRWVSATGVFSWNGIGPSGLRETRYLWVRVLKSDPGESIRINAALNVSRWSPVGAWPMGGEC
jgi:hypothetical protein